MVDDESDGKRVRIVGGSANGPTELAAYDAALADAGLEAYNLSLVSSVVPSDWSVDVIETAPPLGPPGGHLIGVQARSTVSGDETGVAGLGWATGDGPGVIYEATGHHEAAVRTTLRDGLSAAQQLRDHSLPNVELKVEAATARDSDYGVAVVFAAFGYAKPLAEMSSRNDDPSVL